MKKKDWALTTERVAQVVIRKVLFVVSMSVEPSVRSHLKGKLASRDSGKEEVSGDLLNRLLYRSQPTQL